jgi:hypothetical protein
MVPTEIRSTRLLAGPRRDATRIPHRPSRIDAEDIVLVLGLGLISSSAAFLIVNGSWSF